MQIEEQIWREEWQIQFVCLFLMHVELGEKEQKPNHENLGKTVFSS